MPGKNSDLTSYSILSLLIKLRFDKPVGVASYFAEVIITIYVIMFCVLIGMFVYKCLFEFDKILGINKNFDLQFIG